MHGHKGIPDCISPRRDCTDESQSARSSAAARSGAPVRTTRAGRGPEPNPSDASPESWLESKYLHRRTAASRHDRQQVMREE